MSSVVDDCLPADTDTDPFLLDSDLFPDDPFLPQFWSGDVSMDMSTGIT